MTAFNIEPQYLYKLVSMPRGMQSHESIGNRCNVPLNSITIDFLGNCFVCDCDGWLPIPVGKVQDFSSIEQVLNNDAAKLIQTDVELGHFSWCAVEHCGIKKNNITRSHLTMNINIDESCNLACPSCRRDAIMINSGPEFERKSKDAATILTWLEQYNEKIHIVMSGNGDPLASAIMRPIIKNFYPKPQQTFTLFTNGLLIKKQISEGMPIFDSITNFNISVDAGSKEVYEDVRRPGNWELLLENFNYLASFNKTVKLNFAVQSKNYKDIPNFIKLCAHYGFAGSIHQLDDWGTWAHTRTEHSDTWTIKNGIYSDHDVLNTSHPENQQCLAIISKLQHSNNIKFAPNILNLL